MRSFLDFINSEDVLNEILDIKPKFQGFDFGENIAEKPNRVRASYTYYWELDFEFDRDRFNDYELKYSIDGKYDYLDDTISPDDGVAILEIVFNIAIEFINQSGSSVWFKPFSNQNEKQYNMLLNKKSRLNRLGYDVFKDGDKYYLTKLKK